jgi:hypothetical protein
MTNPLTPLHADIEDRITETFPDWTTADLRAVVEVAIGPVLADLLSAIDRMKQAENALLMFGWSPPYPATTAIGKAFMELYLQWCTEREEGFLDAESHSSLTMRMRELADGFDSRQGMKPTLAAPKRLIVP